MRRRCTNGNDLLRLGTQLRAHERRSAETRTPFAGTRRRGSFPATSSSTWREVLKNRFSRVLHSPNNSIYQQGKKNTIHTCKTSNLYMNIESPRRRIPSEFRNTTKNLVRRNNGIDQKKQRDRPDEDLSNAGRHGTV